VGQPGRQQSGFNGVVADDEDSQLRSELLDCLYDFVDGHPLDLDEIRVSANLRQEVVAIGFTLNQVLLLPMLHVFKKGSLNWMQFPRSHFVLKIFISVQDFHVILHAE